MIFDEFVQQLTDAYEHLYDLVHLRNHSLIESLTVADTRKERAWQLHSILLQTIEELDPGTTAPAFSREWRRHRLMVLRYTDGLTAQTVADQLAISRRHYYREHEGAIRAVAQILWNRIIVHESIPEPTPPAETIRIYTNVGDVVEGALLLFRDKLAQKRIEIIFAKTGIMAAVDGQLLRQLILALLGYLVDRIENTALTISVNLNTGVTLQFSIESDGVVTGERDNAANDALQKLAALATVQLEALIDSNNYLSGFIVRLRSVEPQPLILIVDDNSDLVELFRRYLETHNYNTISAHSGIEALENARTMRPAAILLDLMMPNQDGWDVLQSLLNQPESQNIPVIVCSILPQQELALSLGAEAFLQKPISEDVLINALEDILSADSLHSC